MAKTAEQIAADKAEKEQKKEAEKAQGKTFKLTEPIAIYGESDVLLMQRASIPVQAWKFVKFGTFPYTMKLGSKTFDGVELVSDKGKTTLKLSARDLNSEVFKSFIDLEIKDNNIEGMKLKNDGVVFGISVQSRPYTDTEKQIANELANKLAATNPTKADAQKRALMYDKRTITIVGQLAA